MLTASITIVLVFISRHILKCVWMVRLPTKLNLRSRYMSRFAAGLACILFKNSDTLLVKLRSGFQSGDKVGLPNCRGELRLRKSTNFVFELSKGGLVNWIISGKPGIDRVLNHPFYGIPEVLLGPLVHMVGKLKGNNLGRSSQSIIFNDKVIVILVRLIPWQGSVN